MNTISIQNITEIDIDEIIAIGMATPELHIENEHADYYSFDMLKSFITSPHDIHLTAKIDGVLAGYFFASVNTYLKEAYLIDMVIKPEFRKQGIATLLFEKAFDILKEHDTEWAWCLVDPKNETMMQVLDKKGFKRGKQFQFFYRERPF